MSTVTILIGVIVAASIGAAYLLGWFKLPGSLFDSVEEFGEDALEKAKEVKEKFDEIKEELEDVAEELKDVVSAVKGKPTKSKLNSLTKKQLVESAKVDFDVDIDISLKKSNIVNKVYALYNNK